MSKHLTQRANVTLWIVQGVLAALFLFAGGMKELMPIAALTQQSGLPGWFMRGIGIAEMTGALGLILPGLFKIKRGLTPIAALGLITIMAGAVTISVTELGIAAAALPCVVGLLLISLVRGRAGWLAARGATGADRAPARGVTVPRLVSTYDC